MKTTTYLFSIFFLLNTVLIFPSAQSQENTLWHVSLSGDDSNSGVNYQNSWKTIDYAVSNSSPVDAGDTILVHEGTYMASRIDFKKSGAPGKPVVLKASGKVIVKDENYDNPDTFEGLFHLWRQTDWVIDGFRIEDAHFFGIGMFGCSRITVKNVYTKKSGASGITAFPYIKSHPHVVPQSWNIYLYDCTVEEANWKNTGNGVPLQEGISIAGVDTFEVARCRVFHSTKEGIDIKSGSRNGSVHHCVVHDQNHTGVYDYGGNGIYIDAWQYETYNIDVYNNLVYSKDRNNDMSGIPSGSENGGDLKNVRIFNNVIYNMGQTAFSIGNYEDTDSIYNIAIYNNSIYNCRWPLRANTAIKNSKIILGNNIFYENDNALEINKDGVNLLLHNNIIDENPQWLNPAGGSFLLTQSSQAIDNGVLAVDDYELWFPGYDLLDKNRITGAAIDLGPYEFDPTIVYPNGISLSAENCTLANGETLNLSAEISPENADDQQINWYSTNPAAFTVQNGEINMLDETQWGYAIAATRTGNFTDSCLVNAVFADSVVIAEQEVEIELLHYYQFNAQVFPENAYNSEIRWESSNPEIVKHLRNGQVKALSNGIAYFYAILQDGTLRDSVKIISGNPQSIENESMKNKVSVFPNPVKSGIFHVKFQSNKVQDAEIHIFDMNGRKLFSEKLGENNMQTSILVSELENGIYNLLIINNQERIYKKLVIMK